MSKLINSDLLTTLEEYDVIMRLQGPHLSSAQNDITTRKNMSLLILSKKEDEILLIYPGGFLHGAVLAGITEKNIEYIAKHAPMEYKENIMEALHDQETISDAAEIIKILDKDANSNANQERFKNVIQYIKDNIKVFQF